MTPTVATERTSTGHLRLRRAATLVGAAAVAFAGWVISVPIIGVDLTVDSGAGTRTVGPASIVAVPLLAGGAAWALLAWLERRSRNGRRAWRITAWVALAISLLGPVSAGAAGGALVSLVALHLAVGTALIFGLAPASAGRLRAE